MDDFIDASEVRAAAKAKLKKLGLRLPRQPQRKNGDPLRPKIPGNDPTKLTDRQVSKYLWQFNAMADYIEGQLSLLELQSDVAKTNENARKLLKFLKGSGSIKNKEAEALTNEDTQEATLQHHKRKAEFKLLKAVYESYVRQGKTMSREQSRRDNSTPSREPA